MSDNYTKLDINVYNYTGNKRITEIWKKTAPVVWQDAPYSADYSNHKYTWKGTVSKGTYTYDNSKTVTISDDVEVFAEINNSSSSSSSSSSTHYIVTEDDIEIYPYYYKGAIDTSGTDLTIKTDITTGIVKKILKTQVKEGNFMDDIGYAMDSLQYLSLIADVEDIDSSDRDDDAVDAIEKMAKKSKSEAKIPSNRYFDITVCFATYDKDGGTGYTEYSSDEIEDARSSLTFKYTVPEGTRLSGSSSSSVKRRYRIYTYHEDDEEAANCNDDWKELDSNAFSFSSKKFSTFALSYYDSSSSTSSSSGSSYNSSMRSGSGSGSSPVNDTIDKSGAPKTGDDFDARKWVFILIIGVVVALCSLILYQDTKDWREDKREK